MSCFTPSTATAVVPQARQSSTASCGACGPITRHSAVHLLEVDDTNVELCASILRGAVLHGRVRPSGDVHELAVRVYQLAACGA